MPIQPPVQTLDPEDFRFVMVQLVLHGWVADWGVRDGDMFIEWTETGRTRRGWLRTIERELQPNGRARDILWALAALEQQGDEPLPRGGVLDS